MKTWLLVLIVGCTTLQCSIEAAKIKVPKAVKQLNVLCLGLEDDMVDVTDEAFDFVFSELNDTCDTVLDVLNGTGRAPSSALDGIKTLSKICKWYSRAYDANNTNIDLEDMANVCSYYEAADNSGLTDKVSRKTLKKVTDVCRASKRGTLVVKNDSYADVFTEMEAFCADYMNETNNGRNQPEAIKAKGKVNGIKFMDSVCDWIVPKYGSIPQITAPGILSELVPICEDFIEVRDGSDFDITKEPIYAEVVALCAAEATDSMMDYDEAYDEVFEDVAEYCSNMTEYMPKMGRKPFDGVKALGKICIIAETMEDEMEDVPLINGLEPICEDFEDVNEEFMEDFNVTEERGFKALVMLCLATENENFTLTNENFTDIFDDLSDFCTDLLEDLDIDEEGGKGPGEKKGPPPSEKVLGYVCDWYGEVVGKVGEIEMLADLGGICSDYEELVDELYPFDLMKEKEFWMLIGLCNATVSGRYESRNESAFSVIAEDFTTFCVALLDNVDVTKPVKPPMEKRKKPAPIVVLAQVCNWYKDISEEEEVPELAGLDPICKTVGGLIMENQKDKLMKEREFGLLLMMCKATDAGNLTVTNENYVDVFEDFGGFCGDLLEDLEEMMMEKDNKTKRAGEDMEDKEDKEEKEMMLPGGPILALGRVCEWYWDVSEDIELVEELLEDLDPICEDLYEVTEELDEFGLLEDEEFMVLNRMCMASVYGNLTAMNGNFTDILEDFGGFCEDFLEDMEELYGADGGAGEMEYSSKKRMSPVKSLGMICEWYGEKVEDNGPIDLLAGLEDVCQDLEDKMDELYPFDVTKERGFMALVLMCMTDAEGNLTVENADYADIFDDFGEFCGGLLDNVTDLMGGKPPMKKEEEPKPMLMNPVVMLAKVCEWYEETVDEEGEIALLDGFDVICSDLGEIIEDDEEVQFMMLLGEEEFLMLIGLCKRDARATLEVDEAYEGVFEDLSGFCVDFLNATDEILGGGEPPMKKRPGGGDDDKPMPSSPEEALGEVCEWYDDEEPDFDLLDDLDPICSDFFDIEDEDDGDDDGDDGPGVY